MALDQSALSELLDALRAGGDLDVVREGLALVLQALIEAEAAQQIGAGRYERSASRTTHATAAGPGCCRPRPATSSFGSKLREGSFFPALLEPRRRIDRALLAVVMEAYVHGTSTRKVDDLVRPWAWLPGSPSPRSAGSVASWMARWPPSAAAAVAPASMCSWTPPMSRPGWTAGLSPERW